jgi:hypothetical protein
MKNLLFIVFVLFLMGLVAYIVSYVVSLGNFVVGVVGIEGNQFGDPYVIYTSLVVGILSIIAVLALFIIGFAIRREGVEV